MMEPAVIYEYEKEQNRIDALRVNNAYYDMFGYGGYQFLWRACDGKTTLGREQEDSPRHV